MSISLTAFLLSSPLHPSRLRRPRTSLQPYPFTFRPCYSRRSPRCLPATSFSMQQTPPPTSPSSDLTPPTPIPSTLDSTPGFSLVDLPQYLFSDFPASSSLFQRTGTYAIRDAQNSLVYMGYSKNISAKLKLHTSLVPDKCVRFQVYIPQLPPHLISAEVLENVLEFWVRENGAVPKGNTVDRMQWERSPQERKKKPQPTSNATASESPKPPQQEVPIRERSTVPRSSVRREKASGVDVDPFADNFRSATGSTRRRKKEQRKAPFSWQAQDEDYVEVDVDPLDPFSASKKKAGGRPAWDFQADDDEPEEDWMPLVALMGFAGLIWLFGLLSNALPAATPSLGM